MSIYSKILAILVSLEFFIIMYLETFVTSSDATSKIFNLSKNELNIKSINTLFKNQGIYNGLIGLGILYGVFLSGNSVEICRVFLVFIILVALYGSVTSDKKIILTQGGLAIITLISTFF